MWIFSCDRCHREDGTNTTGPRENGLFCGTITALATSANHTELQEPIKFSLCGDCWKNLQLWMFDNINVKVPMISTIPQEMLYDLPRPVIQELDPKGEE